MPIAIACPTCGQAGNVPDHFAGQSIRCPKCQGRFPVPLADRPAVPNPTKAPAPVPRQPGQQQAQCPFCSEAIQSTAKKCKHCGEWLDPSMPQASPLVQTVATTAPEAEIVGQPHRSQLGSWLGVRAGRGPMKRFLVPVGFGAFLVALIAVLLIIRSDGSPKESAILAYVKAGAHDPGSIAVEPIREVQLQDGKIIVLATVRGKNQYGALVAQQRLFRLESGRVTGSTKFRPEMPFKDNVAYMDLPAGLADD
jgi:hypothetical protein